VLCRLDTRIANYIVCVTVYECDHLVNDADVMSTGLKGSQQKAMIAQQKSSSDGMKYTVGMKSNVGVKSVLSIPAMDGDHQMDSAMLES